MNWPNGLGAPRCCAVPTAATPAAVATSAVPRRARQRPSPAEVGGQAQAQQERGDEGHLGPGRHQQRPGPRRPTRRRPPSRRPAGRPRSPPAAPAAGAGPPATSRADSRTNHGRRQRHREPPATPTAAGTPAATRGGGNDRDQQPTGEVRQPCGHDRRTIPGPPGRSNRTPPPRGSPAARVAGRPAPLLNLFANTCCVTSSVTAGQMCLRRPGGPMYRPCFTSVANGVRRPVGIGQPRSLQGPVKTDLPLSGGVGGYRSIVPRRRGRRPGSAQAGPGRRCDTEGRAEPGRLAATPQKRRPHAGGRNPGPA